MADDFGDALVTAAAPGMPDRFFDRWMVNLHPLDGSLPELIVGGGVYPPRDVTDGFAVVVVDGEQRNARFSTHLTATAPGRVGPLSWRVLDPMERWRVRFDDPELGVRLDVEWRRRAPAWSGTVVVENDSGDATRFDHLFQPGLVDGELVVDGRATPIEGWYSQRDRSRGVRTMSGGQGLHVWLQAQFADACVGFLLVESRDGDRLQLEGAVMGVDGLVDPIVDVAHDLVFDDRLDLRSGRVRVTTAGGRVRDLTVDAGGRGGYMAGGGYGGHHGRDRGLDHVERDRYPLDGSVGPRDLDTPLTDRLARFRDGAAEGSGIIEFAHSRSASYRYRPSL
jgi:hypothetical protein